MIALEIKEKLVCLQLENKMLKLKQKGNEDKLPTVQALLEDSEERLNILRGKNRKANQRIIELENRLEEALGSQSSGDNKTDINLGQKITQLQDELGKIQAEKERLILQVEERENALQAQKQKASALQEKLTRREYENAALEERYKKYVEKAKSVIKSLDPKQNNSSPNEVAVLRNQILEQRKIMEDITHCIFSDRDPKKKIDKFVLVVRSCRKNRLWIVINPDTDLHACAKAMMERDQRLLSKCQLDD